MLFNNEAYRFTQRAAIFCEVKVKSKKPMIWSMLMTNNTININWIKMDILSDL